MSHRQPALNPVQGQAAGRNKARDRFPFHRQSSLELLWRFCLVRAREASPAQSNSPGDRWRAHGLALWDRVGTMDAH